MDKFIALRFDSYSQAERLYRQILNRYEAGQQLTNEDDALVRSLLAYHPALAEKLDGWEVLYFEVHPGKHGTRCFYAVREDLTKFDFSYKKCLKAAFAGQNGTGNQAAARAGNTAAAGVVQPPVWDRELGSSDWGQMGEAADPPFASRRHDICPKRTESHVLMECSKINAGPNFSFQTLVNKDEDPEAHPAV